jgi:hypothetical protein
MTYQPSSPALPSFTSADRPRDLATGRVLAEFRAEVKLRRPGRAGHNGHLTAYRAYFNSLAEVAEWMASSPDFLATAARVREIVIVRHNPDPGPAA